jgi:hypothetical protein
MRIYLAMTAPGSVEEDDSILLHFVNFFVIVGRNYLDGFVLTTSRELKLELSLMEGVRRGDRRCTANKGPERI